MPAKTSSGNNSGCLMLFALPFAAIGVWMFFQVSGDVGRYLNARGWEETPANITQTKLESSSDSDGGTTYKATAQYEYMYHGRQYIGSRVSIHDGNTSRTMTAGRRKVTQGGGDNIGAFQQNVDRELQQHKRTGRPFRCYVNPQNPAESVLYRNLRWEMIGFKSIFALVFGGVGFGILIAGIIARRKAKRKQSLAAEHPDEPWLCNPDWADGKVKSSSNMATIGLILFTIVWNVISWPVGLLFVNQAIGKAHPLEWLALIFPAVGVILLIATAVSVSRLRKYGRSMFEMASVPGVIGGQLAGVIRVSKKVQPEGGFHITLGCIQKTVTGSGDSQSTHETILWQEEQTIARELRQADPERTAIPVLFQIPFDCHATDDANANDQTIWRLEAKAKTPGLDYAAAFDLPVFKTPESDPNFAIDRSAIAEYAAPENLEEDLRLADVIQTPSLTGEGCRLVFPMARQPGTAFMFTLVGAVFCAVPFVMYFFASGDGWAPKVFAILFGGFFAIIGAFMLYIATDLWFYRSVVEASHRGMTVAGGLFGIGRTRQIAVADIAKIEPKSRLSSTKGASKKMYYDIDIILTSGKHVTAGKNVPEKRPAEAVIRQIEQAMGKEDNPSVS